MLWRSSPELAADGQIRQFKGGVRRLLSILATTRLLQSCAAFRKDAITSHRPQADGNDLPTYLPWRRVSRAVTPNGGNERRTGEESRRKEQTRDRRAASRAQV